MFSKILSVLCAAVLTAGLLCGCGAGGTSSSEEKEKKMEKIILDSTNSKLIGRTYLADNGTRWCALSGSGAEFDFTGKKLDIMIEGDNVTASGNSDNYCRVGIYVDGERVVDDLLDDAVKLYTPIDESGEVTRRVRIVKLSETAMSCMGICPISPDGEISLAPTESKSHSIEFIGDSITCGYGVDDEDPLHHFKTATEDVTQAYAYKTAQLLDADYSMFSISGWGIVSGYTDDGKAHREQLIPTYYEKYGFTYGNFGSVKPQDLDWDFAQYQPELVVINLGTNDDSYCGTFEERQREYADGYKDFLKTVRAHNPDAHILCALGIMGTRLCPTLELACEEYSKETGDTNISTFRFEEQNSTEDGLVADYHPTKVTHDKASAALAEEIRRVMSW